ncbi:MAG: hypothetical protein IT258_14505 [Saprospiraceae bacterium]|nr:hypothetical protein [Saprospiraceae bacterium]
MRPSTFFVFLFFYGMVLFMLIVNESNPNSAFDEEYSSYSSGYSSYSEAEEPRIGSSIWGNGGGSNSWLNYEQSSWTSYRSSYKLSYGKGW